MKISSLLRNCEDVTCFFLLSEFFFFFNELFNVLAFAQGKHRLPSFIMLCVILYFMNVQSTKEKETEMQRP